MKPGVKQLVCALILPEYGIFESPSLEALLFLRINMLHLASHPAPCKEAEMGKNLRFPTNYLLSCHFSPLMNACEDIFWKIVLGKSQGKLEIIAYSRQKRLDYQ